MGRAVAASICLALFVGQVDRVPPRRTGEVVGVVDLPAGGAKVIELHAADGSIHDRVIAIDFPQYNLARYGIATAGAFGFLDLSPGAYLIRTFDPLLQRVAWVKPAETTRVSIEARDSCPEELAARIPLSDADVADAINAAVKLDLDESVRRGQRSSYAFVLRTDNLPPSWLSLLPPTAQRMSLRALRATAQHDPRGQAFYVEIAVVLTGECASVTVSHRMVLKNPKQGNLYDNGKTYLLQRNGSMWDIDVTRMFTS